LIPATLKFAPRLSFSAVPLEPAAPKFSVSPALGALPDSQSRPSDQLLVDPSFPTHVSDAACARAQQPDARRQRSRQNSMSPKLQQWRYSHYFAASAFAMRSFHTLHFLPSKK